MEFLFGEGQYGLRILVAVFLVLALIGVLAWLVRVFRSERTGAASKPKE
jgi:flagellar biogenesis protein FliO